MSYHFIKLTEYKSIIQFARAFRIPFSRDQINQKSFRKELLKASYCANFDNQTEDYMLLWKFKDPRKIFDSIYLDDKPVHRPEHQIKGIASNDLFCMFLKIYEYAYWNESLFQSESDLEVIESRLVLKWEDHHYFYLLKDIEILDRAGFRIAKSKVRLNYAEGTRRLNEFYYLQHLEKYKIPILEQNEEYNFKRQLEKFYGKQSV